MDRAEEDRLAAQLERDAGDPDAWEADPALPATDKKRLGAQVTVRLDPDDADRLRRIADARRVGYTSLVREWIIERLREDAHMIEQPRVEFSRMIMSTPGAVVTSTGVRTAA